MRQGASYAAISLYFRVWFSIKDANVNYRKALALVVLLAAATSVGSFYAQYVQGLNPCPLCIIQRVAVMATGLMALLCLLWPLAKQWGRTAAALLASMAPLGGLGVAFYQIWLQSLPQMEQPSCGAPWTFRLREAPLFDWYEPVIRGTGNCGVVERVFGVPLPIWSALFFSTVLLWLWLMWWRNRRA